MKTVLTNGCFDGLHLGHIRYLETAKKLGEKLIVLIDSDESARRIKGSRVILHEAEREAMVASLRCVDETRIFNSQEIPDIIRELCPIFYVKGEDARHKVSNKIKQAMKEVGGKIVFIPLFDTKFRKILGIVKSLKEYFVELEMEKYFSKEYFLEKEVNNVE